jgi:hypothetical protein
MYGLRKNTFQKLFFVPCFQIWFIIAVNKVRKLNALKKLMYMLQIDVLYIEKVGVILFSWSTSIEILF